MDKNFRRICLRLSLKADPQPALTFFTPRRDGIGENKKGGLGAALSVQSLQQQIILVPPHGVKALAADIPIRRPITRVAHRHIVGRDGFGDGPGGAAGAEEPARHFLSGADFGKRAIPPRILIDALGFLASIQQFISHGLIIHSKRQIMQWALGGQGPGLSEFCR